MTVVSVWFVSVVGWKTSSMGVMLCHTPEGGWTLPLSIQRFDFIITLVTLEHALQSLLPLTIFYKPNNVTLWRQQRKQSLSSPSYNKRGQIQGCGMHCMKALWNWQRNLKFYRGSRAGKQTHCAKMFPLTPFISTGRGRCTHHSLTTCCREWTHDY